MSLGFGDGFTTITKRFPPVGEVDGNIVEKKYKRDTVAGLTTLRRVTVERVETGGSVSLQTKLYGLTSGKVTAIIEPEHLKQYVLAQSKGGVSSSAPGGISDIDNVSLLTDENLTKTALYGYDGDEVNSVTGVGCSACGGS